MSFEGQYSTKYLGLEDQAIPRWQSEGVQSPLLCPWWLASGRCGLLWEVCPSGFMVNCQNAVGHVFEPWMAHMTSELLECLRSSQAGERCLYSNPTVLYGHKWSGLIQDHTETWTWEKPSMDWSKPQCIGTTTSWVSYRARDSIQLRVNHAYFIKENLSSWCTLTTVCSLHPTPRTLKTSYDCFEIYLFI